MQTWPRGKTTVTFSIDVGHGVFVADPGKPQDSTMSVSKRSNVKIFDSGKQTMLLAHGNGHGQNMSRDLEPLSL